MNATINRIGRMRVLNAGLVVLVLLILWAIYSAAGPEDGPTPDTVRVERGTVVSTVSADGNVEPPKELSLGFEQGGRLSELAVDDGERVKRGQLLARLDGKRERAQLRSAERNLDSARAQLADTRAGKNGAELAQNDRQAAQSQVAVRNAERDLANARSVSRTNVKARRRAVRRARISGERSDLRASELRLRQERTAASRLGERFEQLAARNDQNRDQLTVLRDRQREARNDASSDSGGGSSLGGLDLNDLDLDGLDLDGDGDTDAQEDVNDLDFLISTLQTRLEEGERDESTAKSDLETSKANVRTYVQDVDQDRVAVREARRTLGSARDDLSTAIADTQQQIDSARSSLASSRSQGDLTRANIRVDEQPADEAELASGRANVAVSEASVEDARKALADTRLRAPVSGVIGDIDAKEGELVGSTGFSGLDSSGAADTGGQSPGTSAGSASGAGGSASGAGGGGEGFIELAQLESLQVKANFNETEAAKLNPGDSARISVDALPEQEFSAVVASIAPIEDVVDNVVTYEVTLLLESDQAQLKPGMTATADVMVGEADNVLTVPQAAVRSPKGANATLNVLKPNGEQEAKLVVLGLEGDSRVEVVGGVGEGERVVLPEPPPPPDGG